MWDDSHLRPNLNFISDKSTSIEPSNEGSNKPAYHARC